MTGSRATVSTRALERPLESQFVTIHAVYEFSGLSRPLLHKMAPSLHPQALKDSLLFFVSSQRLLFFFCYTALFNILVSCATDVALQMTKFGSDSICFLCAPVMEDD